jgi:hypothetical protein
MGKAVDLKQVSWKSEDDLTPASGSKKVTSLLASYGAEGPAIEFRYSNTPFAKTDSSPSNWTARPKKVTAIPSISARYWQLRAVLRSNVS